jgi:hypothetical protein
VCPGSERGGFKPESLSAAVGVPKGSASLQLTTGGARQYQVLYRRPYGTDWETLDLDTAMDMVADRVLDARRRGCQQEVDGHRTRRSQPGQGCHLPGTHSFWSPLTVTAGLAIRSHTRPVARGMASWPVTK